MTLIMYPKCEKRLLGFSKEGLHREVCGLVVYPRIGDDCHLVSALPMHVAHRHIRNKIFFRLDDSHSTVLDEAKHEIREMARKRGIEEVRFGTFHSQAAGTLPSSDDIDSFHYLDSFKKGKKKPPNEAYAKIHAIVNPRSKCITLYSHDPPTGQSFSNLRYRRFTHRSILRRAYEYLRHVLNAGPAMSAAASDSMAKLKGVEAFEMDMEGFYPRWLDYIAELKHDGKPFV